MTQEADIRLDVNPTPTRFLLECGAFTPGFGLTMENSNPFEASYKFLNTGTPKGESDPFDSLKPLSTTSSSSPGSLKTQFHSRPDFSLLERHPWSDMVFDEACMPAKDMSPEISSSSTSSTTSSSSSLSPSIHYSSSLQFQHFRSRMSSTSSDHLISHPTASDALTHEYDTVFDKLVPKQSHHSDQDLPALAPDSPTPDSLMPSDTLRNHHSNNKNKNSINMNQHSYQYEQDSIKLYEQEMSDHRDSGMDVDSNESIDDYDEADQDRHCHAGDQDDEDEDEDENEYDGGDDSRESSSMSDVAPAQSRVTRATARAPRRSASSNNSSKNTKSAKSKKSTPANNKSSSRKSKAISSAKTSGSGSAKSQKSSANSRPAAATRKHSSPEEESPEAKRQKFLERNRMAASKCREKKRLQTLKTISDADAITARNQALHESLDELQEEVRALKNQILCHRDCGCDVIQQFVKSSSFPSAPLVHAPVPSLPREFY